MGKTTKRILLVGIIQLVLFELMEQYTNHRKESTDEILTMLLIVGMFCGVVWAVYPAFKQIPPKSVRLLLRISLVFAVFTALYTVDYIYSWHIRPNLGIYREPDWVKEVPEYQKQLRNRIQNNLWNTRSKLPVE